MQLTVLGHFHRSALEAWIDRAIALLDEMDGDENLEDGGDDEPWIDSYVMVGRSGVQNDLERDDAADEPSLGWTLGGFMGPTFEPDREVDESDLEEAA